MYGYTYAYIAKCNASRKLVHGKMLLYFISHIEDIISIRWNLITVVHTKHMTT